MNIPQSFRETAIDAFGDKAHAWLPGLPHLLEELASEWDLVISEPVPDLNANYVCYATTTSGEECVLKVGVPHRDLATEIEALGYYQGRGIVQAMRADPQRHAILLGRIRPGTILHDLKDNHEETRIAAGVFKRLRTAVPAQHSLPNMMDKVGAKLTRYRPLLDEHPDFPAEWIDIAEEALRVCRQSGERDVLLHGDLHHKNILHDDKRGWITIDPKGCIGHPGLEVGRFSFNFLPGPIEDAEPHIRDRIAILTEELEDDRVRERAMVDIVQCLCSTIGEEENGWKKTLLFAAGVLAQP